MNFFVFDLNAHTGGSYVAEGPVQWEDRKSKIIRSEEEEEERKIKTRKIDRRFNVNMDAIQNYKWTVVLDGTLKLKHHRNGTKGKHVHEVSFL